MAIGTGAALLGGAVIGGVASSQAAGKAADAQTDASDAQIALQRGIYNDTTARFEPFLELGTDYANALRYELLGGKRPRIGGTDYEIETIKAPATSDGSGGFRLNPRDPYNPGIWNDPNGPANPNNLARPDWALERGGNSGQRVNRGGGQGNRVTKYQVGGETFDTMEEAQRWVRQNRGGHKYRGFQATPGYQFALEQGQAAIDNSAASRGNVFSGATLKAQQEYGTGMANQEYGNYLNRLTGQAAQGQAAAGNIATAGANYGAGAGTAYANMGNAQAAGYIGQGNAINNGISNALGAFGYMQPQANALAPTTSIRPQARPF